MDQFNHISIESTLDFPRIRKLLSIGLFSSVFVLISNLLLIFNKHLLLSSILGLFFMTIQGLSMFGIYRLMAESSPASAHNLRTGIFGYSIFGPICYIVYSILLYFYRILLKLDLIINAAKYFLLPALILFMISFIFLCIVLFNAFNKEYTPYPKWCSVFNPAISILFLLVFFFTDQAYMITSITLGMIWTFAGLLILMKKVQVKP